MGTILWVVCSCVSHEEFLGASGAARQPCPFFDLFEHEAHVLMVLLVPFPWFTVVTLGLVTFWEEHDALLFIQNLDFELLMTLNLLLTAVSLSVSIGPVLKIQSRLSEFISLNNVTTSLSVSSGFPQQGHELWPIFYSWFSLLSWILLASKTCKTGSAALKQRLTSLWVWVFGSHLFQKNVFYTECCLPEHFWFLVSC